MKLSRSLFSGPLTALIHAMVNLLAVPLEHLAWTFHTTPGTLKVSLLAVPLYNVPTHWKIFHGIHTTPGTLVVNILTLPLDNESVH